jgi:peptide deformylase
MGNIKLNSILIAMIVLLSLLSGCEKPAFTSEEEQRIMSGPAESFMRLFTINVESDSILLRQENRKVGKEDLNSEVMLRLKERMMATVQDTLNPGVGIAAPQVGVSIRMICVQRLDKEDEPFEAYYNPEITAFGDSVKTGNEGCLSVPGYYGKVERPQQITITYLDQEGNQQTEDIEDFTAVIFQHEIDHLNGKLYFDRIPEGFTSLIADEE